MYLSEPNIIKFVEDFNNDIDMHNFLNLIYMGDYKFCERQFKRGKFLKFKPYVKNLKTKKYLTWIKSRPFYHIRWQDEYSFVKNNFL